MSENVFQALDALLASPRPTEPSPVGYVLHPRLYEDLKRLWSSEMSPMDDDRMRANGIVKSTYIPPDSGLRFAPSPPNRRDRRMRRRHDRG